MTRTFFQFLLLSGILFFMPPARAQPMDMSQQEAVAYMESNVYLKCEVSNDCILTGNPCGQLVAVNKSEHERYAFAAALYSRDIGCPIFRPQEISRFTVSCQENICRAEMDAD